MAAGDPRQPHIVPDGPGTEPRLPPDTCNSTLKESRDRGKGGLRVEILGNEKGA